MYEEIEEPELRKRVKYHVQRDVLDELSVDKVAEKSDFEIPLKEKFKDAVRFVIVAFIETEIEY